MNIRSQVSLEVVRDNLSFYLCIPSNTTHDVALSVIEELKSGVEQMKKTAEERQKEQEASTPQAS